MEKQKAHWNRKGFAKKTSRRSTRMLIPTMEIVLSAAAAALAIEVLDDSVEQDSNCDDFFVV